MKEFKHLTILFFIIVFTLNCHAQWPNDTSTLARLKISNVEITAIEYENDIEIKRTRRQETYDKNGNETSFTTYDESGKPNLNALYKVSTDKTKKEIIQYLPDSTIQNITIYLTDNSNNISYHYQLSGNRDTLVWQKRFLDINGHDSILYTQTYKNKKFQVTGRYTYDKKGNLINRIDFLGKRHYVIDTINNCTTEYDEYNSITGKECRIKNDNIDYFYSDGMGYLFGIKLKQTKGGRRIERRGDTGLVREIRYENKKGKLFAIIKYEYK